MAIFLGVTVVLWLFGEHPYSFKTHIDVLGEMQMRSATYFPMD